MLRITKQEHLGQTHEGILEIGVGDRGRRSSCCAYKREGSCDKVSLAALP